MKLHPLPHGLHLLLAETPAEIDFVGDIYSSNTLLRLGHHSQPSESGGWLVDGVVVSTDYHHPQALAANAARELARAAGEFIRLGLGEAAQHIHAGAPAADPHAQEQLSAGFVELQRMLHACSAVIVQQQSIRQRVVSTHIESPVVGRSIVALVSEGGAA